MRPLAAIVTSLVNGVRNVNARYAEPQIEMTSFVRVCLLTLRVYLLVLIGLMLYKFIITVA